MWHGVIYSVAREEQHVVVRIFHTVCCFALVESLEAVFCYSLDS